CVNQTNIDVPVRLPFPVGPNTQISNVSVSASFSDANPNNPYSRAVQLRLNGVPVGDGMVPDQPTLSFPAAASLITPGSQTIGLRAVNLNDAHYTVAENFALQMNVSYHGTVCASPSDLTQLTADGDTLFCQAPPNNEGTPTPTPSPSPTPNPNNVIFVNQETCLLDDAITTAN